MKNRILLFVISLFVFAVATKAQQPLKIGHVNVQELVQKHPEMDSIRAIIEKEAKDMEEIYAEMLEGQEADIKKFEEESEGYSDFVKETKQKAIMEQAQKIQEFNASAQQRLQQRNMELIQPVYQMINQEVANIAGAQNFTYILDVSNGAVAYISPESEDITDLVLAAVKGVK